LPVPTKAASPSSCQQQQPQHCEVELSQTFGPQPKLMSVVGVNQLMPCQTVFASATVGSLQCCNMNMNEVHVRQPGILVVSPWGRSRLYRSLQLPVGS